MCPCVCVHVCPLCPCVSLVPMCVRMCVPMSVCVSARVHVPVRVCPHECVHPRVPMCVCVHAHPPPPHTHTPLLSPSVTAGWGLRVLGEGGGPIGVRSPWGFTFPSPLAPSPACSLPVPTPSTRPLRAVVLLVPPHGSRGSPGVCNPSGPVAAGRGRWGFSLQPFPETGRTEPKGTLLPSCGFLASRQALAPGGHALGISNTPGSGSTGAAPASVSPSAKGGLMPTKAPSARQWIHVQLPA